MIIEEVLFRELVEELTKKSKSKIMKNLLTVHENELYEYFIEYFLLKDNSDIIIDRSNFKENFVNFYKDRFNKNRINFDPKIRELIAEKSAYCCAMPHCRVYTKKYDLKDIQKPSGFGQAAHIYSASKNNTIRASSDKNKSFVKSEKNGMWLCGSCHPYADYKALEDLYPVNIMNAIKSKIEQEVASYLSVLKKRYTELTIKEKDKLHEKIADNKKNVNYNQLTKNEANNINIQNAIGKVTIKLSPNNWSKFNNLEKIEIGHENIIFEHVDKEAKSIMSDILTLQKSEKVDFLLNFKSLSKNKDYPINNCLLTRFGSEATSKGYLFRESNPFHKIFIFEHSYNKSDINDHGKVKIQLDFKELLNGSYEVSELGNFNEILDLMDSIENDLVQIKVKKENFEKFLIINDYDHLNYDIIDFKKIIKFLKIVQYIAYNSKVKIPITKKLLDENQNAFNSLDLLYNTIILDNIPDVIMQVSLGNDFDYSLEHYNEIINEKNKCSKIEMISLSITILCEVLNIELVFENYSYVDKNSDYIILNKTETSKVNSSIKFNDT